MKVKRLGFVLGSCYTIQPSPQPLANERGVGERVYVRVDEFEAELVLIYFNPNREVPESQAEGQQI